MARKGGGLLLNSNCSELVHDEQADELETILELEHDEYFDYDSPNEEDNDLNATVVRAQLDEDEDGLRFDASSLLTQMSLQESIL